jgi:hypothetical protein
VSAENLTKNDYIKIEKKIKKYTNMVYRLVKPEPEKFTIEDLKEQINQDLKFIYKKLRSVLDIKIKYLPYISISKQKSNHDLQFGVYKRKKDMIYLDDEYIGVNLKGIMLRELLRLIIPNFLDKETLNRLALLFTYPFLKKGEQEEWRGIWSSIEKIPFKLLEFDQNKVIKLLRILHQFDRYNALNFNNEESEIVIPFLINNMNITNYNELFYLTYLDLYKQVKTKDLEEKDKYLIYAISHRFLTNKMKNLIEIIGLLENEQIKEFFEELYYLDWIYAEQAYRNIDFKEKKLRNLIESVMIEVRYRLIDIKLRTESKEISIKDELFIQCEIKNKSKNKFTNLEIKEIGWKPKDRVKLLDKESLDIIEFKPGDQIKLNFEFKCLKAGKIKLKSIILSCKDINENLQEFRSNSVKLLIKDT